MALGPPPIKGAAGTQLSKAQSKAIKKFASGGNFLSRAGEDLSSSVSNIARGIPGLAEAVGTEVKSSFEHSLLGSKVSGKKPGQPINELLRPTGGGFFGNASKQDIKEHPFLTGQGQSFRNTYNRLSNPEQALRDYSQHPISSLAEDAANIGIVTAPAAKALQGTRVGEVLGQTNRALNVAAQGPFIPVSATARAANKVLAGAGRTIAKSERGQQVLTNLHLDEGTRAVKHILETGKQAIGEVTNRQARLGRQIERGLKSPVEQEASLLLGEHLGQALSALRQAHPQDFETALADLPGNITPQAAHLAADVVEGKNPKLAARVDAALRLGREAAGGRQTREEMQLSRGMHPEQTQTGPLTQTVERSQERLLRLKSQAERIATQRGRVAEAAAQSAQDVGERIGVKSAVARESAFQRREVAQQINVNRRGFQAAAIEARATERAAQKVVEATAREHDALLRQFQSAPPDWSGFKGLRRDWAASQQRYSQALSDYQDAVRARVDAENLVSQAGHSQRLPVVPALTDAERAARTSRQGGRAAVLENIAQTARQRVTGLEGALQSTKRNTEFSIEAMPGRFRPVGTINRAVQAHLTGLENSLRHSGLTEQAAQIGRLADSIPTTLAAFAEQGIDPEHFIHIKFDAKPASGISPLTIPSTRGKTRSQKFRRNSVTFERTIPAQAKAEVEEFTKGIKTSTVEQIGQLPLSKKLGKDFLTEEQAKAAGFVPVTAGSEILVPERIKKAFEGYFSPSHPTGISKYLLNTYDFGTKVFKIMVLPLSPAWNVNNMIGNAFMATVGGGVDPLTLSRNIIKAIKDYRASGPRGLREFSGPDRLYQSGATFEALDFMNPSIQGRGALRRGLSAIPNVGYRVNQFVDNVGRTAVYMAKLDRGHSPELALREALRAMGDFSKMSGFEKNVVRRVIPFYAWQKHITKLMFTLPIEHPLRTAWTLELANQYGDAEDWVRGLADYLQGLVPIGGGNVLPLTSGFPFSINPLENFTSWGRNLSPQLKLLLANTPGSPALGINPLSGQPYSRPPGTGREDQSGNLAPTSPSILRQLIDMSPQARLYENLSGRNDIARYSTGDPILQKNQLTGKKEPIPGNKPKGFGAVLKFLGMPIQSEAELKAQALRTLSNRQKNQKTREGSSSTSGLGPPKIK